MVREMSSLGTNGSCTICFEDYTGDPATILIGKIKGCGHFYHFECIWTWLESKRDCPLCRGKAELKEDDIHAVALRHLLHELKDKEQNQVHIDIPPQSDNQPANQSESPSDSQPDTSSKSDSSKPDSSKPRVCEVTLDMEPSTSKGVSNDGFEDVDISDESSEPVKFTVGDDLHVKS